LLANGALVAQHLRQLGDVGRDPPGHTISARAGAVLMSAFCRFRFNFNFVLQTIEKKGV